MGPLVPDIISPELDLIVAFLLGIAFGFVLEQAGFSSSRRLTGLFYGTDFTVLRVFFTAGVTAMSGVLLLSHFGLLDMDIVYINPTFLQSAILGGVIMGLGFVVGGFCPGTSVCGAAVGKIDGMIFVLGGLVGIFLFGESYPFVMSIYTAGSYGDLIVSQPLGITQGQFALMLIVVAVAAFAITTRIEKRVNRDLGELPVSLADTSLGRHRRAGVGTNSGRAAGSQGQPARQGRRSRVAAYASGGANDSRRTRLPHRGSRSAAPAGGCSRRLGLRADEPARCDQRPTRNDARQGMARRFRSGAKAQGLFRTG